MRFALSILMLGVWLPATAQNSDVPTVLPVSDEVQPDPLPDWRVRRKEFVRQLFGLQAGVETLPGTAFDTARNFPREWGRTWSGVGKRYANQYGQFLLSETIEFGVGAVHHEDPRYFRLGPGNSTGRRAWHAVKSTWVARSSNGDGSRVAFGRIAGVYGAWYIAQFWSPGSVQGFGPWITWGTFGMGTKSSVNVLREFWPDIRKKLKKQPQD